ncbi:MAG TPA: ABC transporter ATP-binding protein, partial [Ferruginibacter sp.]|nr:ABC transporter ATP-binding protein [Ferruginibacter sp.]
KEWEDWKARREAEAKQSQKTATVEKPEVIPAPVTSVEEKPVPRTSIDKELKKELQRQKNLFKQSEEKLAALNEQKTKLEQDLASPEVYNDKNKFLQTETAYKTNAAELVKANAAYEAAFEKLMELEDKIQAG